VSPIKAISSSYSVDVVAVRFCHGSEMLLQHAGCGSEAWAYQHWQAHCQILTQTKRAVYQ
jgi:hypothetical protein